MLRPRQIRQIALLAAAAGLLALMIATVDVLLLRPLPSTSEAQRAAAPPGPGLRRALDPEAASRPTGEARPGDTADKAAERLAPPPASAGPAEPVRLEHPHQSADGRTLVHGLGKVRLAGLDGPTGNQVCADEFDVPFACGLRARAALHNHVRGREILCRPEGAPDGDVIPARCAVEGRDLGRLLAAEGWVRPAPTHPDLYRDEVEEARREKRGLWNGGWRPVAPPQAGPEARSSRGPG